MHDTWRDMFVLGLPLAEKILRPIFVYGFLVISLRLSGKRELVQLNPFRFGGAADAFQYRAERYHRRR